MQETGLGSEMVRAPRLPLEGAEREEILGIIRRGIATRPTLPAVAMQQA
jgi:4-hydroxy-tetrahydrodipicolinate synthase